MADTGFFDRIGRFFNSGNVRKREGPATGQVIFPTKVQSELLDYYQKMTRVSYRRSDVYQDMDQMDEDIVARALDMASEDATQVDVTSNQIINVSSTDKRIEMLLNAMVDRLGLEEKLQRWARDTAKYGDLIPRLILDPGKGISFVNDSLRPEQVCRLEKNGKLVGFLQVSTMGGNPIMDMDMKPSRPYEFIHFRTPRHRIFEDLLPEKFFLEYDIDPLPLYGSPIFIKSRRIEKKIKLADDALMLARLGKSQIFRVHYLDIGDNSELPQQKQAIQNYKAILLKQEGKNFDDNSYQSERSPFSYADEIIIPYRTNGQGKSEIQTIGGDVDINSIVDVDYLNSQRFGTLGIPKQYLSFDGDSTLSYNSLVALDPRYSRKIAALQKDLIVGLTHLAQIELYLHNIDPDPSKFKISLTSVSTNGELDRADALSAVVTVCSSIMDLLVKVDEGREEGKTLLDKTYLVKYLLAHYMRLPDLDIESLFPPELTEESSSKDQAEEGSDGKEEGGGEDVGALFASNSRTQRRDLEFAIDKVVDENSAIGEAISKIQKVVSDANSEGLRDFREERVQKEVYRSRLRAEHFDKKPLLTKNPPKE